MKYRAVQASLDLFWLYIWDDWPWGTTSLRDYDPFINLAAAIGVECSIQGTQQSSRTITVSIALECHSRGYLTILLATDYRACFVYSFPVSSISCYLASYTLSCFVFSFRTLCLRLFLPLSPPALFPVISFSLPFRFLGHRAVCFVLFPLYASSKPCVVEFPNWCILQFPRMACWFCLWNAIGVSLLLTRGVDVGTNDCMNFLSLPHRHNVDPGGCCRKEGLHDGGKARSYLAHGFSIDSHNRRG